MNNKQIIQQTADYLKEKMTGEGSGHDWWHVYRVWNNAVQIARQETADMFVVELAALLHDIADWKFHQGDEEAGPRAATEWLRKLSVEDAIIDQVCTIIREVTFKGAGVETRMTSKEGMIVQDADRLDAIGAIGIARAFAYGGSRHREIYNPGRTPENHETFEQYKSSRGTTINHFYEKLLLLKDRMNTEPAKKIALERHKAMEEFLQQFFKEWEGKDFHPAP